MAKRTILLLVVMATLISCALPKQAPIDTQATISAGIAQTQTALPSPTTTLAPTDTPAPTSTPSPTSTPKPTNTPISTGLEESSDYPGKVATLMTAVSENLTNLATMSTMMGEDISLVLNDDFKSQFFKTLDTIYEKLLEIVSLTPPASFETSHGYINNAFYEFTMVRSLLKSGINNLNAEDLSAGVEHMTAFSDYISLATEALGQ